MPTLAPAVLAAAAVAAVDAPPSGWPATGEKVRVMRLAGRSFEKGVVVQTDAQFLTVSLGSGRSPVRIPLASIERLEVGLRSGCQWLGSFNTSTVFTGA